MALLDPQTAGMLLLRLQGHWPRLGADELSSDDWLRAIRQGGDNAATAVGLLVTTWARDRAPNIADWQDVCRQVARRHALEAAPRPLPAGRPDPDVGRRGIAAARAALAQARTPGEDPAE